MRKRTRIIPPNLKPANPDATVMTILRRLDSGLEKSRRVDFYLYFAAKLEALQAQDELMNLGFSVQFRNAGKKYGWLCLSSREMAPDQGDLIQWRKKLTLLATRFGGNFDGWETEILNDGESLPDKFR